MSQTVINVRNVSKIYKLYDSPTERLKESIMPFTGKRHRDFYALQDVSFSVNKGETISIIGKNGSGKSTLLKIITGVLTPSAGSVDVQGKVAALLELGAGFNPELTGIENIYLSGMIMGYSRGQINDKLDAIIAFADIGEYIHQPVKMYSSGMFARLAFAVNTNVDPDIFIVDEALSVGDIFFQTKSMRQIKKMVDNGTTLLFVSHDLNAVKGLCQKAIWLNGGRIELMGEAPDVVNDYSLEIINDFNTNNRVYQGDQNSTPAPSWDGSEDDFADGNKYFRIGTFSAKFRKVEVLNSQGKPLDNILFFNQRIIIKCYIEILEPCEKINVCYHIKNKQGQEVVGDDSILAETGIYNKRWQKGDKLVVTFATCLPILHGSYSLNVLIVQMEDLVKYSDVVFLDSLDNVFVFEMKPKEPVRLWDFVYLKNEVHYEIV